MDKLLPSRAKAGQKMALGRIAAYLLRAGYRAVEHARQRRALAQLSDERLRDLGLTRHDVARETEKPFWRP